MGRRLYLGSFLAASTLAGLLVAGGLALIAGANLWPLTALLGAAAGFVLGGVIGVLLRLAEASAAAGSLVLGLSVAAAIAITVYLERFHSADYGRLLSAEVLRCESSGRRYVPPFKSPADRRAVHGVDVSLLVRKERRLQTTGRSRIIAHPWVDSGATGQFFKPQADCDGLRPGTAAYFRSMDLGQGVDYLYDVRWRGDLVSKEGRVTLAD
jgi:hypothetical protein